MAVNVEAPVFMAASALGLIAGGASGPLNFPLSDFGAATLFASIGVVGRAVLDARDARTAALAAGASPHAFDFVGLAYGLFATPLIGGMALAFSRQVGFVPDFAAVPIIMGMGYMGRDGVSFLLDIVRSILSRVPK